VKVGFGESQSEAARSVGLHPSQLNRIIQQKAAGLRPKALEAIERLVPSRYQGKLHETLLNDAVEEVLTTGERWRIWAHDARHLVRRTYPHPFEPVQAAQTRESGRKQRFSALRWTWEEDYPAACNALKVEAAKYDQSQRRLQWAWERMLEPLLDAEDTAFLERSWDELSEPEKRRFVEASVTRERILLRRDPDLQRAKRVIEPSWRKQLGLGSLWPTSEPALDEE
jgi:hypothetical protein